MAKNIKTIMFIFVLILVIVGILKDRVLDTALNCKKKVGSISNNNDLALNIFDSDKTFVYKMYFWSIIPMGELRYSTQTRDSDVVFSFEALTKKSFVEKFITANARVESYFSKKDLLPYKYVEITKVNGKVKQKEVFYDRAKLLSVQGDKKIKISRDTYDPVGAFVHMLTLSFEQKKDYKIPFLSGHDMYVFKAKLINKVQDIDEISIDMRRQNLTSSHGGHLHVWITADNNRIPLLFKSWTPAGYASVVLDRVSIKQKGK